MVARRLRFSFEIDFWFPVAEQLCLSSRVSAKHIGFRRSSQERFPPCTVNELVAAGDAVEASSDRGRSTKVRPSEGTDARHNPSIGGDAQGISDGLRKNLPSHALALLSLAIGSASPEHSFTVFDKIMGPVVLRRLAAWTPEQVRPWL